MVTVPANQIVAIYADEYVSEAACNANCMREPGDKCWVCASTTGWDGWTQYYCGHKADLPFSYLGDAGKTKIQCIKNCIKLEELPYELA